MAVRFRTGNTSTLTLAGDLTTGLTTAFVANIASIDPGEWTIGERDVSVLLDEDFMRTDPEDLAATNEITGVLRFSQADGVPEIQSGVVAAVTVTFPQVSTATAGVTRATVAGNAFFTRFKFPNLANNETMDAEFTLKMTGENLAFTKEAVA